MAESLDIWHGSVPADQGSASFFRQYLSDDELARADRFRFSDLRLKFAQRRGILRFVLAQYLGQRPADIRFQTNSFGKPFLGAEFNQSNIQFSLSHSQDRMVVAINRGCHLGIDVEVIRDGIDNIGLAESFFASEDIHCIRSKSEANLQRQAFFDIWTGKEAYIKALGAGLSIPLDQFSIDMELEKPKLRYARHRSDSYAEVLDTTHWHFERLCLDGGESACLAVIGQAAPISVYNFDALAIDSAGAYAKLKP